MYEGFDHQNFALSWGGERDYATWFGPEPSAMLGFQLIQLIPMGPVNAYLAGDPLALADPEAARAGLETLSDEFIDDGDSRTYLMAWIPSQG